MFLSYLKSCLLRRLKPLPRESSKNRLSSFLSSVSSSYTDFVFRSYIILKTWAIIAFLFCIFGLCSIGLYFLFFYTIMPVTVQESCVQMFKDHQTLTGIASSNIVLEKERYKIFLKLNLPEDDTNFAVGNFQTSLSFMYKSYKVLELRNMGIMKYYSPTTRVLRALFRFPLIVLGLAEEAQDVIIEYSHTIENPDEISDIKVSINPADLRINSISIVFQVELNGLRLFVLQHRILSFTLGTLLIFLSLIGSFMTLVSLNYDLPTLKEHQKPSPDQKSSTIQEPFEKSNPQNQPTSLESLSNPEPFDFSQILKPIPKKSWYS